MGKVKQEPQTICSENKPAEASNPSANNEAIIEGAVSDAVPDNGTETIQAAESTSLADLAPVAQQEFDGCFQHDGKKYRVRLQKVNIPGIGVRTALELANDSEAQQWLIDNNYVGSIIEEVIQ